MIRSVSTAVRVREGHSVQLNCHATGSPKPQIIWYKDNDTYTPPANRDVKINKSVTAFISVVIGLYFCFGSAAPSFLRLSCSYHLVILLFFFGPYF